SARMFGVVAIFCATGCEPSTAEKSPLPSPAPVQGSGAPPASPVQGSGAPPGSPGTRSAPPGTTPVASTGAAAPALAADPAIAAPASNFGEKTEADARAFLEAKIEEALKDGPAPLMVERPHPKFGRPYVDLNPALIKILSQNPVRSKTVEGIEIRHVVKLRAGEFCPRHKGNNFLV